MKVKTKRLTHPTWKYKTRRGYLRAKENQIFDCILAMVKVQNGCAWLPKKVRLALDLAEKQIELAHAETYKLSKKKV